MGDTFALKMVWDQPNKQFLFSLNDGPEQSVPYTASDGAEAFLPVANIINQSYTVANCHDAPAVIDSTVHVHKVRTNTSALIP